MRIEVKVPPELFNLILATAESERLSLGNVLRKIAAEHYGKPDLGKPPPMGRPRRPIGIIAPASSPEVAQAV